MSQVGCWRVSGRLLACLFTFLISLCSAYIPVQGPVGNTETLDYGPRATGWGKVSISKGRRDSASSLLPCPT